MPVSGWLAAWWWRLATGPDRLVLLVAVGVRGAAICLLGLAFGMVWGHFPEPGWSLLLAAALTVESLALAVRWLQTRSIGRGTLLVDVPTSMAAVVVGSLLAAHHGPVGWTDYAFPYTILIGLTLGLACRSLRGTLLAGLLVGAAELAAATAIEHQGLLGSLYVLPSYLVNPVVGWTSARLLRRGTVELDRASRASARQATALAIEQERVRHARALHDRVLQTMETLARGTLISAPDLRGRVAEEAAWLRRFVETGVPDQENDLPAELAAAVRAVSGPGVEVQLNDAAIRADGAAGAEVGSGAAGTRTGGLDADAHEALVRATHQALAGVARGAAEVIVRATAEPGGVLVTILAARSTGDPDLDDIENARNTLRLAGGSLTMDPVPYLELWVPASPR
jgi:hypothetical protein